MEEQDTYINQQIKKVVVDLGKLEKAIVIYDQLTDTLHINLADEEAEETLLLENGIIVRIKNGSLVGLSIQGVSKQS
ncbi:MAG: DUF2283 domain-containing protein [Ignisphaera sp.]|uniref:DUF2283 domain-containing protein n=1 Tax=Ignisphaera aggregans TaxID=334771 RepID=A0A7C4NMU2_9CREN